MEVVAHVPLAPFTTMGVGGPARFFFEARDETTAREACVWAREHRVPIRILGGGSNLVIDDAGVDALVMRMALRGVSTRETDGAVEITAAAGEPWDAVVADAVARGWAGIECLSGIPGFVGATPIQNVGAYGQEVSDTITAVRALDRAREEVMTLTGRECGFAYRDSRFKSGELDRWIVLSVTYRLRPGGAPTVRYAEVAKHLEARGLTAPTIADVRDSVLTIRRDKSMVLDPKDPNRRSCGSFFTNPIVSPAVADALAARTSEPAMPRWPQPDGRVKLSAAWLIERAGFKRGENAGHVGLSTRHTLAIVCYDGARARDVIIFASRIRNTVAERFDIRLTPEPMLWGGLGLED